MNRKRLLAELALAGVTVIWGTTFVVVKSALQDVSTFVFLALRFWVAAAALLLIYRTAIRKPAFFKQGIRPGVKLTLSEQLPFQGAYQVRIGPASKPTLLSHSLAEAISVAIAEKR